MFITRKYKHKYILGNCNKRFNREVRLNTLTNEYGLYFYWEELTQKSLSL